VRGAARRAGRRVGLSDDGRRSTAGLVDLEVRCAEASDPTTFADQVRADVLLLCGIFGNAAPTDVKTVIAALPMLLPTTGS
jgi:hypothetical protein